MTESPAPVGWATVRLDDIAEVRLGRQRSPKNHTGDQMRRYLRAANLTWSGIDTSDVKEMNFTDEEVETYRLKDGDLLLSEASGSAKEVGKPGVWRGQLDGDICFQNTLIRVRPEGGVDSDFLYYRFLHEALRGGFGASSRGVGIHHLGSANLAALELRLPPTREQRFIADTLDERLTAIGLAQRDLELLRRRAQGLTDSVLNNVAHRALDGAGTTTPAGNVCVISGGIQKQPKRQPTDDDPGVPFLRVANVGRRRLDLNDVHRILITDAERDRVLLKPGDLLVVEGNGSPDQIGRAALWQGQVDPCTHQNHLIRVRPDDDLLPSYLDLIWNAPSTAAQLVKVASTTSGLYTLSTKKVAAVEIPVPSLELQTELVARAEAELALASRTVADLDKVLTLLEALRQSTLRGAFDGSLGIDRDADEPVETLLKAIVADREARAGAKRTKNRTVRKNRARRTPKTKENPE